jgi:proton-coupled amino acid transporter
MDHDPKSNTTPLLSSKRASKLQTLGNIIVTVVGTGVLGLPFAFRIAGWVAGSIGVAIVGISTYYCMLLLVGHLHFFSLFLFSISLHYLEFFYFIFQLLKM